ncbi:MAG TPA: deoxynucleoside kinase [Candidatus Kapabacteria bacterium]|nr:deoxynucleoside kinase [Candidatus Kapabacteria bacterium]
MSQPSSVSTTRPRYIALEGVIGAGKTTIATMLAERLNGRLVLERFEDNPFLADFYKDPKRFAFQTQIFFLLSRYRQQQEFRQLDLFYDFVVSDYIFDKDRIFASLTLNEHELGLYDSVVTALEGTVPRPDLVVYLQSSLSRLIGNIRNRGRAMEESISVGYLRDLSEAYTQYFFHYTGAPILIVNTAKMDFVNDRDAFGSLVEEILRPSDAQLRFFHFG